MVWAPAPTFGCRLVASDCCAPPAQIGVLDGDGNILANPRRIYTFNWQVGRWAGGWVSGWVGAWEDAVWRPAGQLGAVVDMFAGTFSRHVQMLLLSSWRQLKHRLQPAHSQYQCMHACLRCSVSCKRRFPSLVPQAPPPTVSTYQVGERGCSVGCPGGLRLASRLARFRRRPAAIPRPAQRLRGAMLHHHPAALTVCSALLCLPALSPLL